MCLAYQAAADDQGSDVEVGCPLGCSVAAVPGVGGFEVCLALRGAWAGAFSAVQAAAAVRHGRGAAGVAGAVFRAAARGEVGVAARVAVAEWAGGGAWGGRGVLGD